MAAQNRPKVYVTRRVPHEGIDIIRPLCEIIQWESDDPVPRQEMLQKVAGVNAIFCLVTEKIDAEVMDAAGPSLKVIGTMSVGFDHVDTVECKKRGIKLGYTPEVLTDATAELTVALLLATSRKIVEGTNAVKSGEWITWKPLWLCGPGLANSTVGIIGLGRIGVAVARRLRPFGVSRIVYCGWKEDAHAKEVGAEYMELDELLAVSDFITTNCALTPETKRMFNKKAFAKMKNTVVFINTSRGGVVHQEDLYEALKTGQIGAAGLDVTDPEPMPTNHPLLTLPNCVILPHIGSATIESRHNMSKLTGKNIVAGLMGEAMPARVDLGDSKL